MTRIHRTVAVSFCVIAWLLSACQVTPPPPPMANAESGYQPAAGQSGASEEDLLQTLSWEIERLRAELHIPGLSVAVLQHQQLLFAKGFGYADVENDTPATENTAYEIASLTKPFAAVLLMQLVESGKLDLDTPMADLLQDTTFSFPPPGDAFGTISGFTGLCALITELGQTTSGPLAPYAPLFQDYPCDTARITVRHHLSHTSQGTPGTSYRYNGFLFGFLAQVVEAVTGQSFEDHLAANIVGPLGMTHTVPNPRADRSRQILAEMARPYQVDSAGHIVRADYLSDGVPNAASGMVSTVLDLARFDIAMDQDRLVSADSRRALFTPTVSSTGQQLPYGLGWFVQNNGGETLIWHYGWELAYSALLLKVPERELTFILLANSDGASAPFDLGAGDVLNSSFARLFLDLFAEGRPPV